MDLDEGTWVELVQLGHLAGLGHGVPLVRETTGVEQEGVVVVGHFGGKHVRPCEEHRTASGGGKCEPRSAAVLADQEPLTDTVIDVSDGMTVLITVWRAWPLNRCLAEALVGDAA